MYFTAKIRQMIRYCFPYCIIKVEKRYAVPVRLSFSFTERKG
jgi:hypothetical protein